MVHRETAETAEPLAPPAFLLALIAALAAGLLLCMLVGGRRAEFLFGLLAMMLPPALMALGVARRGLRGWVGAVLLALAAVLVSGYLAMVALAGQGVAQVLAGPWFAGLPLAAAIFLAAVWLVPLFLVSLAYGLTFRHHGVGAAQLRRLRRLGQVREAGSAASDGSE